MIDQETRDLIASEVRRQTSPRMVQVLVSLVFVLLMATVHLWNENQVQSAWIDTLRSKVQSLQDQSAFSEEVEKQRDLIEAIAEKLGVEEQ